MPLPFRPLPESDESMAGYSVRLSAWYGYRSPDAFARQYFGHTLPPQLADRSVAMGKWVSSLEESLKLEPGKLSRHWNGLRAKHQCEAHQRIITDTMIAAPRICEQCVAENGYTRFEWQQGHIIVCEQHISPILDQCPSCSAPFKWNANLLGGCSCGYTWNASPREIEDAEMYLRAQANVSDLDTLYRAYLHALFSSGHTIWARTKIPYDPAYHKHAMQQAYRLVCDADFNKQFADADIPVGSETTAGRTILEIRRRQIRELFSPVAAQGISFSKWENEGLIGRHEMVIPAKHHYLLGSLSPFEVAEGDVISEALGITLSELNQLVSRDVIKCVSSSQILRDRVFSAKQVSEDLDKLLAGASLLNTPEEDLLDLKQSRKIAEKFGFGVIDCLEWCRAEELHFGLVGAGCSLSDIRIDRNSLLSRCESKFADQEDSVHLNRMEAMKLLGVPENVLDRLGKEGVLPSEKWFGPGVMFELGTIRAFLAQHRIAKRESVILGVPTEELWTSWNKTEENILVESLPGGHLVGILKLDNRAVKEAA